MMDEKFRYDGDVMPLKDHPSAVRCWSEVFSMFIFYFCFSVNAATTATMMYDVT